MNRMIFGALEAGGTKMVCAIGNEEGKIIERISIPTTTPGEIMPKLIEFFKGKELSALGIGCFGPIDVNHGSKTYGYITSTPKLAWRNFDIVGVFKEALNIPVGFDTDVNGSLLGEATWGCAKGLTDALYLTVGTGVGAGIMINGKLLHGMLHPEAGHIPVKPEINDVYTGKCPYHGTCLEGVASGPAIEERWGKKAYELTERAEVWELESSYLAQALTSYMMILSPQKIILGGGVMNQKQLFPLIRHKVKALVNDYIQTKEFEKMDEYIVPASLNDDQGIKGCIKLAMNALDELNL